MPEAVSTSNVNKVSLNNQESSVIIVTSLRPTGRPPSLRQLRLAEFRSSEAGRKRRKEASRREGLMNRKAIRDCQVADACTAEASVTITAPCQAWINQSLVYPAMEQTKEEQQYDDVKVLYAARDFLYSDSEVAILSSCSSWCVGPPGLQDTDPSRMVPEKFVDDLISPRPCGRVGLDGSTGIGDRYLNKPPEGFIPSDDVVNICEEAERTEIQKPYRQVWHSLWEHHAKKDSVGSSNSAKRAENVSRLVSVKEGTREPTTASVSNICTESRQERKQRRGVFHPVVPMPQTRVTYRSKAVTRPWGRTFYQRAPLTTTHVAQRKGLRMKDGGFQDSERFDKMPKSRRYERSENKNLPRTVVKTASRLGAVVLATEKENNPSPTEQKSVSPPSLKRGVTGSSSNRLWRCKPAKSASKSRFPVPPEASRASVDSNVKEMNSQKPVLFRRDPGVSGRLRSVQHRALPSRVHNATDRPLSDLTQNANSSRDARLAVHFSPTERNCSSLLTSGKRLYSPHLYSRADLNILQTDPDLSCSPLETNAEHKLLDKELAVSDAAPPNPSARPGLKSKPASRLVGRGPRWKTTSNVPIANHFFGHPITARQSSTKLQHIVHPNYRAPAPGAALPPRFSCDLTVSPDVLFDGHSVSDQTPKAFRFSHLNAPDVLISPPPNPQLLDALCGSSPVSENETPSLPVYNPCVQTVNIPRYYGLCTPEASIEENYIPLQSLFQQNVSFRSFMPSIDFSRFEPPPRPYSRNFRGNREDSQRQSGYDDNAPLPGNLQQVGIPTTPYLISTQNENPPKPFKAFLTFSAQVPSSSRIPLKSFASKGLSSPPLEMQGTNILYPPDTLKSSLLATEPPENPTNIQKEDNLAFYQVDGMREPLTSYVRTNEDAAFVEKVSTIKENDNAVCILQGDVSPWKLSSQQTVADPVIEVPQRCSFSMVERVSVDSSQVDRFETREFESTELRSVSRNVISQSRSDTKLNTVTEGSADAQLPGGSPYTDVNGLDFDPPYATNTQYIDATEIEQKERRFQYIRDTDADTMKVNRRTTMTNYASEITSNQKVFAKSEILAKTERNPCEEDCGGKHASPVTRYVRRASDTTPSDASSLTYPDVGRGQQITVMEKSLKEDKNSCLGDVLGVSEVATQLYPMTTVPSIRRFQSLVARLDDIAQHCKLPEEVSAIKDNSSGLTSTQKSSQTVYSRREEKVERRDAYVQVPLLCTQCVETEPFTAEKGVPEGRAGLTLRLMSTVVDVPPVIKPTESIGTNTEDKLSEDDQSYTEGEESVHLLTTKQDNDSRCTLSEQLRTTSAPNASSLCSDDGRRSVVQVPVMDKPIKRLKPFFRSHRCELVNIYNLAAAHGLTLNTDKERSVVSRDKILRSDSNSSIEIRKDKHVGSSDDDWNYHCEHEQPGRAPKQHLGDRRVSFRPFRRETDIFCPIDVCQDENFEHHQIPEGKLRFQNDDNSPRISLSSAKEVRKLKRAEKLHEEDDTERTQIKSLSLRATECVNVVDRPCAKTGGKIEKSSSRWKSGELSELSRPLCEDLNADVIALNRKPGCALCKKSPPSKKKGILKSSTGTDAGRKHKPPHIPRSVLHFGLSSIVTPANVVSQEEIVISTATENEDLSETRGHKSRKTVKHPQKSVSSVVALETSKRTDPVKSVKDGRSQVIIIESLAIKNLDKECASQNVDRCASVNYPFDTDKSTGPTTSLTKSENKSISEVEYVHTRRNTSSMQNIFTAVKLTSGGMKDSENSNSPVDRPSKASSPFCAFSHWKTEEDISSTQKGFIGTESAPFNRAGKAARQVKMVAVHGDSMEDHDFHREISHSNVEKTVQSDLIKSSEFSQLTGGCMFTAMRRFMKNRPRSELSARRNGKHADCDSRYPEFQFTGVPVFKSECLPLDSLKYHNGCKCKHLDIQDWSPTASPEDPPPTCKLCRRRTLMKSSTNASRLLKCTAKSCDVRDCSDDTDRDEDIVDFSSPFKRGHKGDCDKNKLLWQSVYRRRIDESKPISPPTPDAYDTDGAKSGSSELYRSSSIRRNISDNFSSNNEELSCPESQQSSKHVLTCILCDKKDGVGEPTHGIRTLPHDMVSGEVFEMSYPRCASTLPKSSVSSRRNSTRASSAPAGQVRVSPGRCWPPAHSVYKIARGPRRIVRKHVKLLQCDSFTCERCEHRKARQRIPPCMYEQKQRNRKDDVFLMIEDRHNDLDDAYTLPCSCRVSRKDYGV